MGKNGYLMRQKAAVDAYRQAEKETYIQFMTDTLMIVLNDPAVMGKDVFGKARLKRVAEAWSKAYDKYHEALEKTDEADYWQEKLDQALGAIFGDELIPFPKRYDWIKQFGYDRRVKR